MDIRALLSGLCRKVRAFARHRAAARALRDIYPDADAAALAAGHEQCAICRDAMRVRCQHQTIRRFAGSSPGGPF